MCDHFATAPFLFPYFFFLNITNQVISRYERGVTGVPGCGAHHVAVFVDELAGFYFSEEFFGISSYVGGDDFVASPFLARTSKARVRTWPGSPIMGNSTFPMAWEWSCHALWT